MYLYNHFCRALAQAVGGGDTRCITTRLGVGVARGAACACAAVTKVPAKANVAALADGGAKARGVAQEGRAVAGSLQANNRFFAWLGQRHMDNAHGHGEDEA